MLCFSPLSAQTIQIETINVAPFGFTGEKGKPTGMMFEISNKIAEEAGFKYANVIVPYARTILELRDGKADFVLRYSNEQLQEVAIPVVSVVSMQTIILFKVGHPFENLEDLQGKIVGMVRGGKFDNNFDKNTAIHKFEVNDYTQMLKMLMKGRLDAVIGSNVGLYYTANTLGITPNALSSPIQLSSKDFILHFSKKTLASKSMDLDRLKLSVEKLKKTGEIKGIINRYMGDFEWEVSNK